MFSKRKPKSYIYFVSYVYDTYGNNIKTSNFEYGYTSMEMFELIDCKKDLDDIVDRIKLRLNLERNVVSIINYQLLRTE